MSEIDDFMVNSKPMTWPHSKNIAVFASLEAEILHQRAVIEKLVEAAMDLRMFAICKMDDASRAPEMAVFMNLDAAIKKAKGE